MSAVEKFACGHRGGGGAPNLRVNIVINAIYTVALKIKKEEKFKLKKYEDVIKPEMIKYNGFITTYTDTTDFKYFMEKIA